MALVGARGIDEWAHVCSESFVPLRADGDEFFQGTIAFQRVGDVGVSLVRSTRSMVYRPQKLIDASPRDDVLLSIHLSGTGSVQQAGRSACLTPGAAAIYEADRPYDLRFDRPMSELVLQVPRDRLRLRDASIRDSCARVISKSTGSIGVLQYLLLGIVANGCPDELADQLAETALDLLSSTLRPLTIGNGVQPTLSGDAVAYSARVFMQRHLADPSLDVEHVARQCGVSRRYLETLFAQQQDSPAAYLRRTRLDRARQLLADPRARIADVAFDTGFQDITTFGRAFKRAYGLTPRDYRKGTDADPCDRI